MYNIKNKIYTVNNQEIIDKIKLYQKDILFYLTELTERKTGYLYYPIFNLKNKTIITTNVKNDQKKYNLIKPINPKMLIKIVSVKEIEVWECINLILRIFSCSLNIEDDLLYNDVRVFKIHDIIAYLRKHKFDLSELELSCNIFNTVYDNTSKIKKMYCYVERDVTIIMILKNINRLFKTSFKSNRTKCILTEDILEDWINNSDIEKNIKLEDHKYKIILENKTHLINKKLYNKIKNNINEYKIYYVKDEEFNCYTYFIRLMTDKFTLLSGYPNFKIFNINNNSSTEN